VGGRPAADLRCHCPVQATTTCSLCKAAKTPCCDQQQHPSQLTQSRHRLQPVGQCITSRSTASWDGWRCVPPPAKQPPQQVAAHMRDTSVDRHYWPPVRPPVLASTGGTGWDWDEAGQGHMQWQHARLWLHPGAAYAWLLAVCWHIAYTELMHHWPKGAMSCRA
jgi:hypothetical protein